MLFYNSASVYSCLVATEGRRGELKSGVSTKLDSFLREVRMSPISGAKDKALISSVFVMHCLSVDLTVLQSFVMNFMRSTLDCLNLFFF